LIEVKGCDVNLQDDNRNTPLYYALCCFDQNKGGDITVLMYLLTQKNINVNMKNEHGNTLIHTACAKINTLSLDVFKLLIETMGGDINAQVIDKNTPIHYVLRHFDPNNGGNITVLTYLVTQKCINPNITGLYGNNILHYACENINNLPVDIFKVLIETIGCDVNARDKYGNTPLHNGFRSFNPNNGGDINVLIYLIHQKNLNVGIKDQMGFNLLHLACNGNLSSPIDPVGLNEHCDTILFHIVENCLEQVLDERRF